MRFSPFVFLLCVGVLGCGAVTESKAVTEFNKGFAFAEKEDWGNATACFTEAIRLDPKDAEAYDSRGVAYNGKGQYDLAIADFDEAIRLKPDFADVHYNLGIALKHQGLLDEAIAAYR